MKKNNTQKADELESATDIEKGEKKEFREFEEKPGDSDGENRHPTERKSVVTTGLFITKTMIGSGLLNVPMIFKTYGIFIGVTLSIFFNMVTVLATYFLLRCKDVTQRYSYAIYSKLTFGLLGTAITKLAMTIKSFTLCCVLIKIFGNIIRTLLLIMLENYKDSYFLQPDVLSVFFAILIFPTMLQKDISGISKFTFLGIYSILFLFFSLTILLIFKYYNGEIQPFQFEMFKPNGTFPQKFKCFGSFLNAYVFQISVFPIYLPLHPRNTKNMLKSTVFGTLISSCIYSSFGIIGFIIYRYNINDTLLKYLGDDLIKYLSTNKWMGILLIIFEIAFIINTTISTMLNFFIGKSGLIGFIKFVIENFINAENKDANKKDTPLVDMNEKGIALKPEKEKEEPKEDILSELTKNIVTSVSYVIVVLIAYASKSIIAIDNFNGSTVNNYLSLMLPALFLILLNKDKGLTFENFLAGLLFIFSITLIILYVLINFTNIFG